MHCCRSRVLPVAALLLLLGVGVSCATAPTQAPDVSANLSQHSHHHAGAQARSHGEFDPPSSFATRPEVGTEFTCPVSGGVFEVESHTRVSVYQGRYYAMCCGGCQQDFDADPARFVEALEGQEATP